MKSNYIISGNADKGFVLTHKDGAIKYSLCPCCDKPIRTRFAAETLSRKLTELDNNLDGLSQSLTFIEKGTTVLLEKLNRPLSERLKTAREQLSAMFAGGELASLPDDTRTTLHGFVLFLLEAAEEAYALETKDLNH